MAWVADSAPSGFTYDGAGNVLYDGLNNYLYDAEGRLCAVKNSVAGTVTQYVYGTDGTRVAKGMLSSWPAACVVPAVANGFTLTASYVLGLDGQTVSELNGAGQWIHTDIFAGGKLLAAYHDTDTYFALTDWLGTKRVEFTPDGKLTTLASLPYGNGLIQAG